MNPQDIKKLERRAKSLLLDKDIPPAKMDLVRSLINNGAIYPDEKYRTIIDLIQSCPDKPRGAPPGERVEIKKPQVLRKKPVPAKKSEPEKPASAPEPSDLTRKAIPTLYDKYREYKLFKKRLLIHANNRFGIGFRKRLVPLPRYFAVFREIAACQETVTVLLQRVMEALLADPAVEDPTHFNYLRVLARWMLIAPFSQVPPDRAKWMDRSVFEPELKDYAIYFFSFLRLDGETREQLFLLVESRLRELDGLRKEPFDERDTDAVRRDKEKKNLSSEKTIHEFIGLIRSFLPATIGAESALSALLKKKYGLPSFPDFLLASLEALVFEREVAPADIVEHYAIGAPTVRTDSWDYSADYLKKIGKDPETKRRRYAEQLRRELVYYEEVNSLLQLGEGASLLLQSAFEHQWRHIDKKKGDPGTQHEENFFGFMEGCLAFFAGVILPIIAGARATLQDARGETRDEALFGPAYFEKERALFLELQGEIHYFKSNNPTLVVTRTQVERILSGETKSLAHLQHYLGRLASVFYQIGSECHRLLRTHQRWRASDASSDGPDDARTPLLSRSAVDDTDEAGRQFPFFDCTIKGFPGRAQASKYLVAREVVGDLANPGFLLVAIAFCYQLAFACKESSLYRLLDERRSIIKRIRDLTS